MPVFIAALVGALVQAASSMVGRVLVGLGVGLVVFGGVNSLLTSARDMAFQYLNQAAAVSEIGRYMGLLQIGACVNILFSALVIRLTLNGLTGDNLKKWVTK